jgi:hypothetical protein
MSALSQRPRVPAKATQHCAEQGPGADCLQRPLRSRFRQQLRPGVDMTADVKRQRKNSQLVFPMVMSSG